MTTTQQDAQVFPSLELCVQFSDDGQYIRKWSRLPFDGGTNYYSHPSTASVPPQAVDTGEVVEVRRAAQAMSDFIGKTDIRVYATDLVVRELRSALEPQGSLCNR